MKDEAVRAAAVLEDLVAAFDAAAADGGPISEVAKAVYAQGTTLDPTEGRHASLHPLPCLLSPGERSLLLLAYHGISQAARGDADPVGPTMLGRLKRQLTTVATPQEIFEATGEMPQTLGHTLLLVAVEQFFKAHDEFQDVARGAVPEGGDALDAVSVGRRAELNEAIEAAGEKAQHAFLVLRAMADGRLGVA